MRCTDGGSETVFEDRFFGKLLSYLIWNAQKRGCTIQQIKMCPTKLDPDLPPPVNDARQSSFS